MLIRIFLLLLDVADLIGSVDAIFLILELNCAYNLVIKGPYEDAVEHIALIVEGDHSSISWEGDSLLAHNLELDRV